MRPFRTLPLLTISFIFAAPLGISFLMSSCAKQRPIVSLTDPDSERLEKTLFIGMGVTPESSYQRAHWMSSVTVVKTSENEGFLSVGYSSDPKIGHFEFTQDRLLYINDVHNRKKRDESEAPEIINSWKISHYDYRLALSDGKVTNKEEEDKIKRFSQKRFFTIDFSSADISEGASFPISIDAANERDCWSKRVSYLVPDSMTLTSDYIGFVVAVEYQQNSTCTSDLRRSLRSDYTFTVHYRYSFKRYTKNPDYKRYAYRGPTDPHLKQFGFFTTRRERVMNEPGSLQDGQIISRILMNRWDANLDHHFYFAKGTPEEFKWIFADPEKGIFALTNKLFSENGIKARFFIHENTWGDGKEKEFGDNRYSFVKLVDDVSTDSTIGMGNTDADPLTGEIKNASIVIWYSRLKTLLYSMRAESARAESKWEDSSLFTAMNHTLTSTAADPSEKLEFSNPLHWSKAMDPNSLGGSVFYGILQDRTFHSAHSQVSATSSVTSADSRLERLFARSSTRNETQRYSNAEKEYWQIRQASETDPNFRRLAVDPISPDIISKEVQHFLEASDPETLLQRLIYKASLHEMGHALGLTHNFYGSVDRPNFDPSLTSSSVMDYLNTEDTLRLTRDWAPYDKAALLFGYSDGQIVPARDRVFLYCTDEHVGTNALCNRFDHGSSPSEVMMNLIEQYENDYFFVNYRNRRAYWDTSSYGRTQYQTMLRIKKFLPLWTVSFSTDAIQSYMKNHGFGTDDIKIATDQLDSELKRAIRLSIAFYDAVIRQTDADRPWRDIYDPWTGELQRIGIRDDKYYATKFLLGDAGFPYDPNDPKDHFSYLSYDNVPQISGVLNQVTENEVTDRPDIYSWFSDYARTLYAQNATNYQNRSQFARIEKMKIKEYTQESFSKVFGIAPDQIFDASILKEGLRSSTDPYFTVGDVIGYGRINDKVYVAEQSRNPYSFKLIQLLVKDKDSGDSLEDHKNDILDMFITYRKAVRDGVY